MRGLLKSLWEIPMDYIFIPLAKGYPSLQQIFTGTSKLKWPITDIGES